MYDYVKGFVVTLEKDVHKDHAKRIVDAIHMLGGVLAVDPIPEQGPDDWTNRRQIRHDLIMKLYKVLED